MQCYEGLLYVSVLVAASGTVRYTAEINPLTYDIGFAHAIETPRSAITALRKSLPGCGSGVTICTCPPGVGVLRDRAHRPLPAIIIAGAAKAGSTMLVDLLKHCTPPVHMPLRAAQIGSESMYWIPELLPIAWDEKLAWRGWRCSDSTSFLTAASRVLLRAHCTAEGYRQNIFGAPLHGINKSRVYIDKTPDFIIWPHVHLAFRNLVSSGTKFVVLLRDPFLRMASHYEHFKTWMTKVENKKFHRHVDRINFSTINEAQRKTLNNRHNKANFDIGNSFEDYFVKAVEKPRFLKFIRETWTFINDPLVRDIGKVVDVYTEYLYSICDMSDWTATCALKRGPLQSMYLPQLLSLMLYVGGCPSCWLRVVQSEQIWQRPREILPILWAWLGLNGPASLSRTPNRHLQEGVTHRRRRAEVDPHSPISNRFANARQLLHSWDGVTVEYLADTGVALAPFDLKLWLS